jgi:tetratricopeptide (TPR) repeat protein
MSIGQKDASEDPFAASCLSRVHSLGREAPADSQVALSLGREAVAGDPRNAWYLFALGMAHFRAGQHDEAIERLEESLDSHPAWVGRGQNYAALAMACQQRGRGDAARRWLDRADASLRELDQLAASPETGLAASDYLNDWLSLLVLLPEARALVSGSESP